jgi:YqaJ-like viral recombinase domain
VKILHMKQRSEEWHRVRLGIPTCSEFGRILTPGGKLSTQAEAYMDQLLADWMTGAPDVDEPSTMYMDRGTELEPEAIRSYEFETGRKVETVGFVLHDSGYFGGSPDGLILSDKRGLELKCPKASTHLGYMRRRALGDDKYKPQVQSLMMLCDTDYWDIQSYFPGLPTVIIPIARDQKYIDLATSALASFLEVMMAAREALAKEYGMPAYLTEQRGDPVDALGVSDEDVDAIIAANHARDMAVSDAPEGIEW